MPCLTVPPCSCCLVLLLLSACCCCSRLWGEAACWDETWGAAGAALCAALACPAPCALLAASAAAALTHTGSWSECSLVACHTSDMLGPRLLVWLLLPLGSWARLGPSDPAVSSAAAGVPTGGSICCCCCRLSPPVASRLAGGCLWEPTRAAAALSPAACCKPASPGAWLLLPLCMLLLLPAAANVRSVPPDALAVCANQASAAALACSESKECRMASSGLTPCSPTRCCHCCCSHSSKAACPHCMCAGFAAVAVWSGCCAPGRVDAAFGTAGLAIAQEMAAAAAATPPSTGALGSRTTPCRLLLAPPLLPLLGGRGIRCTPGPGACCRVLPAVLLLLLLLPAGLPGPVIMSRPELMLCVSVSLLLLSCLTPLLLLLPASATAVPAAAALTPAQGLLAPAAPGSPATGLSL